MANNFQLKLKEMLDKGLTVEEIAKKTRKPIKKIHEDKMEMIKVLSECEIYGSYESLREKYHLNYVRKTINKNNEDNNISNNDNINMLNKVKENTSNLLKYINYSPTIDNDSITLQNELDFLNDPITEEDYLNIIRKVYSTLQDNLNIMNKIEFNS
jgi:hypothetical protein